jgi:hypothetical protein
VDRLYHFEKTVGIGLDHTVRLPRSSLAAWSVARRHDRAGFTDLDRRDRLLQPSQNSKSPYSP